VIDIGTGYEQEEIYPPSIPVFHPVLPGIRLPGSRRSSHGGGNISLSPIPIREDSDLLPFPPVEWNEHEPPENALFERRKIHRKRRKSPEFHRKRGKSPRVAFRAKTDFFGELSRVSVENSSLTAEKIRKEPSAATGLQPALRFLILLESGIR